MLYDKQPGGVVGVQDQNMVEELIIDGDDHIKTMVSVYVPVEYSLSEPKNYSNLIAIVAWAIIRAENYHSRDIQI